MASQQDPWLQIISEEGDNNNGENPRVAVVYGRRRGKATPQLDTEKTLPRRQRKASSVRGNSSSWSHSLSIRGRESIVLESGVNLQPQPKIKGPSKRPPRPTRQDPLLTDLRKVKEYFEEVDAFELLEESPSPMKCTTWVMGAEQHAVSYNLTHILSRWGLSEISETSLEKPEKSLLPLFDKLAIEDEEEWENDVAGVETVQAHVVQHGPPVGEDEYLSAFDQLLMVCKQIAPVGLREVLSAYCDPGSIKKLGEGTYGEAFRVGPTVCKIVPIDGEILVNNEVQKKSKEVLEEALLSLTLNNLRQEGANSCTGFIETINFRVCQGPYDADLIRAWEEWDTKNGSENDHPKIFSDKQCYIVFVLADGGTDLESFVLLDYKEAQSLLLQVTASLAVAEAACEFEHRDLHWGNILLSRDKTEDVSFTLGGENKIATTFGLRVSIIDFTLSRINTGDAILFLDLSADPALFMGEKGNKQFETYRAMKKVTENCWGGRYPKTNVLWLIYLVDMLLLKKPFTRTVKDERDLRSLKKRMSSYQSARDCLMDPFFSDLLTAA